MRYAGAKYNSAKRVIVLFELTTALRFLRPSRQEFARSLIAILSFGVIATISWLVIVFYSVTEGLEQRWVNQLIQFTGSVRIQPTSLYFQSYEFLSDSYSSSSNYATQPLAFHLQHTADPYQPDYDPPLPHHLERERPQNRQRALSYLLPLLRSANYTQVLSSPIRAHAEVDQWHESAPGLRDNHLSWGSEQSAQIIGFDPYNVSLQKLILSYSKRDFRDLWRSLEWLPGHVTNYLVNLLDRHGELRDFVWQADFAPLLEKPNLTPTNLLTIEGELLQKIDPTRERPILCYTSTPEYVKTLLEKCHADENIALLKQTLQHHDIWLYTPGFKIQGRSLHVPSSDQISPKNSGLYISLDSGTVHLPWGFVEPDNFSMNNPWNLDLLFSLPSQDHTHTSWIGILAPKVLKDIGLHTGARLHMDRELIGPMGPFHVYAKAIVVGFYDPGIFPLGARYLVAPYSAVENFYSSEELQPMNNFLQAWPKNPASFVFDIQQNLATQGLSNYFDIITYEQFPFSRDLILQLQSDKMLLSLIAVVILVVACSSIASMLVLLVNERRKEIAVLKALGLSKWRMVLCFAISGSLIGLLSSCCGAILAFFTLQYIDLLIAALSYIQGQPLLNPQFYGHNLPTSISTHAVYMVVIGSWALSTLAGCLACWHGTRLTPSQLLRTL